MFSNRPRTQFVSNRIFSLFYFVLSQNFLMIPIPENEPIPTTEKLFA